MLPNNKKSKWKICNSEPYKRRKKISREENNSVNKNNFRSKKGKNNYLRENKILHSLSRFKESRIYSLIRKIRNLVRKIWNLQKDKRGLERRKNN